MLGTRERTLLLESLRPPAGYRLRRAVGTSFTLDRIGVDHQRHIREARPGRNIGYVGEPKTVRTVGLEATVHQIGGSGSILIWDGCALRFASDHAF